MVYVVLLFSADVFIMITECAVLIYIFFEIASPLI